MYPWDIADLGVDETLSRLADEGFGAFEFPPAYHPITLHTPGSPHHRLFQSYQGGVFYPARMERFGRIKPLLFDDDEVMTMWPRVAERAGHYGLTLDAWTIGMYQPWIAEAYPDTSRVTPQGHRNPLGVCPSSPDVQEYLATVVADVAERYPIGLVQLEGATHFHVDTGWLLPRIFVDWTPWIRWIDSLCFCRSCIQRASSSGVDVEGLRKRLVAELESHWHNGDGDPRAVAEVDLERRAADEDYAGFVEMRKDASASMIEGIAAALKSVAPEVGLSIWGPTDYDGTVTDLERVLPLLSGLQTRQPRVDPAHTSTARKIGDEHDLWVASVQWCGGHKGPAWGPGFEDALRGNIEFGVDQINLINWAMTPPRITSQMVPLLRQLEAEIKPADKTPREEQ